MALVIFNRVAKKLAEKHSVTRAEIEQCFQDRSRSYLEDSRADHKSDPPTLWFIARGRLC